MDKILTRREASRDKLPRYFTGKFCKRGHLDERYTTDGVCRTCRVEMSARFRSIHPNTQKEYYEANKESILEKHKQYKEKNKERTQQQTREYYAKNKEKMLTQSKLYYIENKKELLENGRQWRQENREYVKQQSQSYYQENRDRDLTRSKLWHKENKIQSLNNSKQWRDNNVEHIREYHKKRSQDPQFRERVRETSKQWRKNNPGKVNANTATRYVVKKHAIPKWANIKEIELIYEQAYIRTKETNVKYVVDHIVPLRGKMVCGLHAETNLRVITEVENSIKRNRLLEELI